ncbi:MAG TPA: M48 family metallopeptidase [Victivallales bacterium]|nr:M48 family metallopeptidase [Victivallales bacterium]
MRYHIKYPFKFFLYFFIFTLIISIFTACINAPYTSRKQFVITSKQEENQLGEKAWKEILSKEKISGNTQYNAAIQRVGKHIANAVNDKSWNWEFKVIDSQEVNAFCLSGGKIAVYAGMFKYINNDAELATIIGHEVGHAIARHFGERLTQLYAQELGGNMLAIGLALADLPSDWGMAYGLASNLGFILPYSREHEYESDYIGIMLMAKAGYNPKAAIHFWEKFSKLSNYGPIKEFFVTHPMGEKRVKELKLLLPEALKVYNQNPDKLNLGHTIKN